MPTYVYECPLCYDTVELVQSISERVPPACDCTGQVGAVTMESVIQPTSFALRGSGWAKDGYSGGKK